MKRGALDRPNDPSFPRQWHLAGTPLSVNAPGAWALNYTGRGVQVAIVDDGVEVGHADVALNYNSDGSWDFNHNQADPSPYSYDPHGTSAAGCASAVANNNVCGVGVAPNSRIAGIRLIAESTTDLDEAQGLSYKLHVNHVLSSSWGPVDDGQRLEGPGRALELAFKTGAETGRGGKGAIYVWAAGNGRGARDNCNYDGYANGRYTIPVAAIVAGGSASYYSEPCAATFCATPSSGGSNGGISTIALRGACSSSFGGTSAAAPIMAGVIALMLEANANLTWRDVQHVIASSALRSGLASAGWATNGGGFAHHHDFGFGRIDAEVSVRAAKAWINVPPSLPAFESERVVVGRALGPAEVFAAINVTSQIDFVEHVDVWFQASSPRRGNVEVSLYSPSGMVSVLATPHNDATRDYPVAGWRFGTVRHWGERASGEWRVAAKDASGGSTFNWARIVVYGFKRAGTTVVATTAPRK